MARNSIQKKRIKEEKNELDMEKELENVLKEVLKDKNTYEQALLILNLFRKEGIVAVRRHIREIVRRILEEGM